VSTLSLYDEIQEIRARYPESRSAVMPALQLAQERSGGWLPEQAFRDVADALGLTPAYCLSIASFYDMFRLEPIGRCCVDMCTNGLAGQDRRAASSRLSVPTALVSKSSKGMAAEPTFDGCAAGWAGARDEHHDGAKYDGA